MKHLRIVDGNTFATSHLIKAVDAQGQEIQDFDLQVCTDMKVYYEYKGNYFPVYLWSIDDQRLNIVWKGPSMRLGIYNLYIKGKFHETDWRIADWYTFEIVKYNKDAYIPEDVTILNGTYFIGADFALITLINGGGGGTPSSTLPLMDGVADVGTENAYARGDHRHPSDTNKQDLIDDLAEIRSGAEAGQTAYQMPTNGIPSTDMAQAVQTSLGKADTAYQKPANGIPATDLASGVIPDVSQFITKSVNDLVNYYTKSQTYTQSDVQQLINAVKQFTYELVNTLPTASASTMNKIYLVPSSDPQTQNVKDEYITLESSGSYSWEQIGSTAIDLSGYVTTQALNAALAGYQTKIDSTHKLDYSLLDNTPTIPDAQVNSDWNANSGVAQILNKPAIPAAQVQSDWNETDNTKADYIKNKPTIPAAQVQSDWNEADNTKADYIKNKPTIPTNLHVELTKTGNTYTANYTLAQILAAVNSGGYVDLEYNYYLYAYDGAESNQVFFHRIGSEDIVNPSDNLYDNSFLVADSGGSDIWTTESIPLLANNVPPVVDALNSSSTTAALSANQGKVLNDGKQDKVLVTNHGTSDTTYAVTPNVLHIWGTVGSLTLTLATPTDNTIVNEYMIEFTSGSTATTLSLPSSVEWAESCGALSVEASKTYQISIVNNIGLWASIANS